MNGLVCDPYFGPCTDEDFYQAISPRQGLLGVCNRMDNGGWTRTSFFDTWQERLAHLKDSAAKKLTNRFHAVLSFDDEAGTTKGRAGSLAAFSRCFVFDIDTNEGTGKLDSNKFDTKAEAWDAFTAALDATSFPYPTHVVETAAGYHCYWALDQDVPALQWQAEAKRFEKFLKLHFGKVAVDISSVANLAGVLRAVPSIHHKQGRKPFSISTVYSRVEEAVAFDDFTAALDLHMPAAATPKLARPKNTNSLGGNLDLKDPAPMLTACAALQKYKTIAANNDTYDAWRSVVQLCAYVEDGETVAQDISKAHPRYDSAFTQGKYDEAVKNRAKTGQAPVTCQKLREYVGLDRKACIGCPQWRVETASPVNREPTAAAMVTALTTTSAPVAGVSATATATSIKQPATPPTAPGTANGWGKAAHAAQANQLAPDEDYRVFSTSGGELKVIDVEHRRVLNEKSLVKIEGRANADQIFKKQRSYQQMTVDFNSGYGDIVRALSGKLAINLFEGFSVKSSHSNDPAVIEGLNTIAQFIKHLGGNEPAFSAYLMKLIAWKWQHPGEHTEVAVVLRSDEEGTGKGSFVKLMGALFAPCIFSTSKTSQIIGNFNAHMKDVVVLCADEATFAADRSQRGPLFSLISEETLSIEQKGRDAFQIPNPLMLILTTNSAWAVPASKTDRRFAVTDVPDTYLGDTQYWRELNAAIKNPAVIAALAYGLERMNLKSFDRRTVPQTKALAQQKSLSANRTLEGFLRNALDDGQIIGGQGSNKAPIPLRLMNSKGNGAAGWRSGPVDVGRDYSRLIAEAASEYTKRQIESRDVTRAMLDLIGGTEKKIDNVRFVRLPKLDVARAAFKQATKLPCDWDDDADIEDDDAAKKSAIITPIKRPNAAAKPIENNGIEIRQ